MIHTWYGITKLWHTAVTKGRRELCHQAASINPPIQCHTYLAADGSSSSRMHSSSNHLLRILDTKQIRNKSVQSTRFWEPNAIACKGIPSCLHTSLPCYISMETMYRLYTTAVCVCFRPIYFGDIPFRSRRDVSLCSVFRGLYTCSVYFSVQLVELTGVTQEGVTQQYKKNGVLVGEVKNGVKWGASVSYTHLTLPTICSV